MNQVGTKPRRLRLDADSYKGLRQQVLQRDGWRCQSCGRTTQLQVHHIRFRSRSGADAENNLITLCAECHSQLHQNEDRDTTKASRC